LRLSPDRSDDDNVATTLPLGTEFEIVARERKPRPARIESKGEAKEDSESNVRYDNWYKVRLKDYAVLPAGWIYGESVTMEGPRGHFQIIAVDKNGQTQKLTYGVEMLEGGKVRVAKPVSVTPSNP